MGDIVNLNQFRKERERRRRIAQASMNREKFGRTKAEKQAEREEKARTDRSLDGAKLPSPEDETVR
jgi:hypothetical protein